MARARRLVDLRADVRKRADVESATERHPDSDLDRYINQGATELRDEIISVRGRSFYRKNPPYEITTVAGTTRYALPSDFYRLISLRLKGTDGYALVPFNADDEPALRADGGAWYPTHYELQAGYLELLPEPGADHVVVLDYCTPHTDLVGDDDELEGYDGWEEYVVDYAARKVAIKDEEWDLVRALTSDLNATRGRVQKLAAHRDAFRAERVRDVRQTRSFSRLRRFR